MTNLATVATATTSAIHVTAGFSKINRHVFFLSYIFIRLQIMLGGDSGLAPNLGFLAFINYTQIQWFRAALTHEFNALSLAIPHFLLVNVSTYYTYVSSGHIRSRVFLFLSTSIALLLNLVTSWILWTTTLPEGFGSWRFLFNGWCTLDNNWYLFFLVWQIVNTLAAMYNIWTFYSFYRTNRKQERKEEEIHSGYMAEYDRVSYSWFNLVKTLLCTWPLIAWIESIVSGNNLVSETDWISVVLFVAQYLFLIIAGRIRAMECCIFLNGKCLFRYFGASCPECQHNRQQ